MNTEENNKENPLLSPFNTVHETVPFSMIENEYFLPAFREEIRKTRSQIQAIIDDPAAPDFGNTIAALEGTGKRLGIIRKIFFNLNSAETSDELQQIAQEVAPMLSEFGNDISLNADLFARVKTVYEKKEKLLLDVEQQTLLENTYQGFVRSGANLDAAGKEQYRQITSALSKTGLQFQQNVLAETNAFELHITREEELSGIPEFAREAAALTARQNNKQGWIFTLQHPSYIPFMKYADNRKLREKMFRAFSSKGNRGNKYDNKEIIRQIVNLKLEKAILLGDPSHAVFRLKRRMAETPEKVAEFLNQLHQASRTSAQNEFQEVQQFATENGLQGKIMRWDWAYYSEKLKNARYGFNEEEVKPYFKLENTIRGVFSLAKKLYGLHLKENIKIQVYHPDVKAYEVYNNQGDFTAVLYLDFFPREGKRSGAWMTDYRDQYIENDKNNRPHISIVTNFTKPTTSKPSLLTFDEVTTLLHEFGHALHGMLSQCRYSETSGTNVFWDFVELPSQMHENWAYEKEWLDFFAVHYESGEKLPEKLIRKLIAAKNYQSGYLSERQLSFGMLDMAYYTLKEPLTESISDFESKAMTSTELFDPVDGALMSSSFSHIFAGGYDAGYYSYKWAEVLDADAFSVFREKGIFDQATADSFRVNILEKGGSEHPMILYKRFRGQEPTVKALLEREGLKPS